MIQEINRQQQWSERHIPLDRHSLYRKVDRIMRRMRPRKVPEVGCLDGRYLSLLRSRGWTVAGIELQPQNETFIVEHDASLPFPFGREFDVVIAVEVIEHIVDTDAFLRHCATVLKQDGILILTTPNLLFWVNRVAMLFGKQPYFAYADYHVRMFVWDDLREKVSRYFDILEVRGSHVLAGVRHSRTFVIFALLGDALPRLSAHFIVVARPLNNRS